MTSSRHGNAAPQEPDTLESIASIEIEAAIRLRLLAEHTCVLCCICSCYCEKVLEYARFVGGKEAEERRGFVPLGGPVSTHSHTLNVLGSVSRIYISEGKELKRANTMASVT